MNPHPLAVDEAQLLLLDAVEPLASERLPLGDCIGRMLAADFAADRDVPAFDRAMMDGFAVRAADTAAASPDRPAQLRVTGRLAAGDNPQPPLAVGPGEAVRIMTGAALPAGADAVCRFEATLGGFARDVLHAALVKPVRPGENVARRGEDMAAGAEVLRRGRRIGAAEAAVLATFGAVEVPVYRRPLVGILSTGSELVDIAAEPGHGQIRNSNGPMLAGLVREAGGVPLTAGPVSDDERAIAAALEQLAAAGADLIVTTGGVSVGDHDRIPAAYEAFGAATVFWKVFMRPGGPVRFAQRGRLPVIGVSGNPAAAFVNAQLFVLPALRRMAGHPEPRLPYARASVAAAKAKDAIKPTRFLRAEAYLEAGRLHVRMPEGQASGMIGSFVGANCLIRLEGGRTIALGDEVDVLLYGEVPVR